MDGWNLKHIRLIAFILASRRQCPVVPPGRRFYRLADRRCGGVKVCGVSLLGWTSGLFHARSKLCATSTCALQVGLANCRVLSDNETIEQSTACLVRCIASKRITCAFLRVWKSTSAESVDALGLDEPKFDMKNRTVGRTSLWNGSLSLNRMNQLLH
jgi:hypothetical protein